VCCRAEVGGQRSEGRDGLRDGGTERRERKDRGQRSGVGGKGWTEGRRDGETERKDRGQRTEGRGRRAEVGGRRKERQESEKVRGLVKEMVSRRDAGAQR
jgi:hypothetical protein